MASKFQRSNRVGWLMAGPAAFLIAGFIILPFLFAIVLSFTNQRLISSNPTQFVGLANYSQLLGMNVLTLDPVTDAVGAVVVKGGNPDCAYLQGLREWFSFD